MSVAAGKSAENAPPAGGQGPAQGSGGEAEDTRALERLARAIAPRSLLDLGFEVSGCDLARSEANSLEGGN